MNAPLFRKLSLAALALAAGLALPASGCGRPKPVAPRPGSDLYLDLPTTDPRPGTAVVILIDTSGSMSQTLRGADGKQTPKNQIARQALERIIRNTAEWKKTNPGRPLYLGVYRFSSSVSEVLPVGEFDAEKARAAIERIPEPTGGTAIGKAIEEGYKALYRSGCARKFIVCITDGENTSGPPPSDVAHGLFAQTQGAVNLEFVAFDTSAKHFRFLNEVKGRVVEASDGAQLEAELAKIYEKRILAEAPEEPGK